tara:strand:+ start:1010 stop:1972 length:963 start_codon:yes stop_codon:yes gene_type:complete
MSIIVFAETWNKKFKKSSFEAVSYASNIAEKLNLETIAIVLGPVEESMILQKYGANKILSFNDFELEQLNNIQLSELIINIFSENNGKILILSNTNKGKTITPQIAYKTKASLIANAISKPENYSPIRIKCKAFSSKASVLYESLSEKIIISLLPNSIGIEEKPVIATLQNCSKEIRNDEKIIINKREKNSNQISLNDADIVISGGRGLKGPENWNMIEELASLLNAGTACSKPVSDMNWRPHSEHVGQTGIAINPDLYIAIGISGAIQHLAGVSSSKKIVVINTDPEAPFFKAADYGIVGDAFDVVPKMIAEIKKVKNL